MMDMIKTKWDRWQVLIVFILMIVLGMIVYAEDTWISVWKVWEALDVASAIALSVMAFMAYIEYAKNEDEIDIVFDVEGTQTYTKLSILRKHFTRSEVLGILGMVQKNPKERFDLKCTKTKVFLSELHQIQKGSDKVFVLPISEEELSQFSL